jgi:hypothetical protein
MFEHMKLNGNGCRPGSTKNCTNVLREAAIIAAGIVGDKIAKREQIEESGLIAFLIDAAKNEPKAYLTFLAKMLPQVHIGVDVPKEDNYLTAGEFEERLREHGLTLELLKGMLIDDGCPRLDDLRQHEDGG